MITGELLRWEPPSASRKQVFAKANDQFRATDLQMPGLS
jgi:hypothetical protein